MSKRLYIVRHAKAEEAAKDDFSRAITKKGRKQSKELGKHIRKKGKKVDMVLCSSAERCRQTYDNLKPSLGNAVVKFDDVLYESSPRKIIEELKKCGSDYKHVMVIGHNPEVTTVSAALANVKKSKKKPMKNLLERFCCAGMAEISLKISSWSDLRTDEGALEAFICADDL